MSATQPKKKSIYGVHPGVAMTQKWVAELKQRTGRSLEEWLRLIKKSGPKDEQARRDWLKTEHGLGTNSGWWTNPPQTNSLRYNCERNHGDKSN